MIYNEEEQEYYIEQPPLKLCHIKTTPYLFMQFIFTIVCLNCLVVMTHRKRRMQATYEPPIEPIDYTILKHRYHHVFDMFNEESAKNEKLRNENMALRAKLEQIELEQKSKTNDTSKDEIA